MENDLEKEIKLCEKCGEAKCQLSYCDKCHNPECINFRSMEFIG